MLIESPRKYHLLAQQMRDMANDEEDPWHAERLRRVAIAYDKRARMMEDRVKAAPEYAGMDAPAA